MGGLVAVARILSEYRPPNQDHVGDDVEPSRRGLSTDHDRRHRSRTTLILER